MSTNIAALAKGLSVGVTFLNRLIAALEERGGDATQLHFMTTGNGEDNLNVLADAIMGMPYGYPMSKILEGLKKLNEPDMYLYDTVATWIMGIPEDGKIPVLSFATEKRCSEFEGGIILPESLASQLHDKVMKTPMRVTFDDIEYLVCEIESDSKPGEVIDSNTIQLLSLVEPKYINLEG